MKLRLNDLAERCKLGVHHVARDRATAKKFAARMADAIAHDLPIAVDTEFDPDTHHIDLMSFAWDDVGYVVYGDLVAEFFGDLLTDKRAKLVYQNFAADADTFDVIGLDVAHTFYADIMIMGWLHDENLMSHDLKSQSGHFLKWKRLGYEKLFAYVPNGKKKPIVLKPAEVLYALPDDAKTQAVTDWRRAGKRNEPVIGARSADEWRVLMEAYSAADATSTIALFYAHQRYLQKIGYWQTYLRDDRAFTHILMAEEERGVRINSTSLRDIKRRVEQRMMRSRHAFRRLAGVDTFNMNSDPQYKHLFLNVLKWPTRDDMVTDAGYPSMDKVAMNWYQEEFFASLRKAEKEKRFAQAEKYRKFYGLAMLKTAYKREATKLSTFINGILHGLDQETGRLHSHLNQIGTDTGRISSRKQRKKIQIQTTLRNGTIKIVDKTVKVGANLQNIPSRAEKDPDGIRRVFEAPRKGDITAYGYPAQEDYELIVADYAGFELCMAIFWLHEIGERDSLMLKTMIEQGSPSAVHALTAIGMYGDKRPAVTPKNQQLYDTVLMPKYGPEMKLKQIKIEDWKLVKVFWPDFYGMAKNGNFNLLYGGSAQMMATLRFQDVRDPDVIDENQQFIDSWNSLYPEIGTYQGHMINHGYSKGWVPTISGRRAHLRALLQSRDRKIQAYGERKCLNTPCQGSAADIVKKAMILLENDECLRDTRSKLYIGTAVAPRFYFAGKRRTMKVHEDKRGRFVNAPCVAQLFPVHDELIVEAPKRYSDQVKERMVYVMKQPYRHRLPFTMDVDAFTGTDWLTAKQGG